MLDSTRRSIGLRHWDLEKPADSLCLFLHVVDAAVELCQHFLCRFLRDIQPITWATTGAHDRVETFAHLLNGFADLAVVGVAFDAEREVPVDAPDQLIAVQPIVLALVADGGGRG